MIAKQLFRNKQKGKIGGVCAGLGEYFEVDITLIRALFLVALLGFGSGFLMYIILWIVFQSAPKHFKKTMVRRHLKQANQLYFLKNLN